MPFYQSKKFWVYIITQIFTVVLAALGNTEWATTIVPGSAYLLGQGMADINKTKGAE